MEAELLTDTYWSFYTDGWAMGLIYAQEWQQRVREYNAYSQV